MVIKETFEFKYSLGFILVGLVISSIFQFSFHLKVIFMKTILLSFILCLPYFAVAQIALAESSEIDSTVIRHDDSLIQISRELTAKKDYDKALEVNSAAEQIALFRFGRGMAVYGACCFNRGRICYFKGDFKEAENWYLESKSIREKTLGKEHPDYAKSLNNLAILYKEMGNYKEAEPLYLESKSIREKTLGKEHPDYMSSVNELAILYNYMGNYEKAESLYLEAKAIREKTLGKEHSRYSANLNNLAVLYMNMGNYEKAIPLYIESKAIREKTLGKEHPDYATSLLNLGILYMKMGNYEKAEPLYLESKTILEKTHGKEHPDFSKSLLNLGILYMKMGNYEKAEPLYLETKAIREKILGKEHPDYASSLNNLALLYHEMGNYEKEEQLLLEVQSIQEKKLGKEHPSYLTSLGNLAIMYEAMGNYEKAELLYLENKTTCEKILGKVHPDYALNLHNLGIFYYIMGKYEKAELLYLEAKDIREKTLGKEHPYYASTMHKLAMLYEKQKRISESEVLLEGWSIQEENRLSSAVVFLSEGELAKYQGTFQNKGDDLGSYLIARPLGQTGILPSLTFNHALFYKGFLLTVVAHLQRLSTSVPNAEEINNRLKGYRRRLAIEYAKSNTKRSVLNELENKAEIAEKELARTVTGYTKATQQVSWLEVQTTLKKDEAAIEFIHFRVNFPIKTDTIKYACIMLLPGKKQPKFIPLFEEKSLDSLLKINVERKSDFVNQLYSHADRGFIPIEEKHKTLYDLIWAPLEKHLQGVKKIYFSPSGLLHRINLDAIPIADNETVGDRYQLIAMNSTRQLVIPSLTNVNNQDVVLYGGINYEPDSTYKDPTPIVASRSRGELSFHYVDSTLRGGNWNYLPGTEKEINTLQELLKSKSLKVTTNRGSEATEESFKNIGQQNNSPRVLHISTHGYFFPDPRKEVSSSQLLVSNQEPIFKISDHPMLRSGLILAGGNAGWKGQKTLEGREDGVLTAYEISQMNLSNTELVVLSACETGLGDIKGNEGVYGLQRAFKIAGAKYLIMSLWQVPDRETKEFMVSFYKNWLTKKESIPEAFRMTQKEMRDRFINPFSWAGFVLVE